MKLCMFGTEDGPSFGALDGDSLYNLTALDPKNLANLNSAYSAAGGRRQLVPYLTTRMEDAPAISLSGHPLLRPLAPSEVWGAGITYLRSRNAREAETRLKGIYEYIYGAARPEIFLKDSGIRCVGPEDEICVRGDSKWTVPEPELTVVVDQDAGIVGYTIGNDVSARDIEGENPLYLPQSKIYRGSCSIGPVIATSDEIEDPHALEIEMSILRAGKPVFNAKVNTSQMKRRVDELLQCLKRDNVLSTFTLLMTGTALVPPDDFTLEGQDIVEIRIEKIGLLRNKVVRLGGSQPQPD